MTFLEHVGPEKALVYGIVFGFALGMLYTAVIYGAAKSPPRN